MNNDYFVKIKPRGSWLSIDFSELLRFREVFYLLVWRDLKVRYKQTLLGVGWALLQPLIATAIFSIIFLRFARFETGEVPYALFALSGFTVWTFISTAVSQGSSSLIYHTHLVTKIYFPRMIVPAAPVGAAFIDLLLTVVILFAAAAVFGTGFTWKILFLPLLIVLALVIALSMTLLLAALNVRFRDVKFVVPFLLQVWMFASPVFYPSEWLPERIRPVFALNPVSGCLDGFRHVLFGTPMIWSTFAISMAVTLGLVFVSVVVFRGLEDDFADMI